MLAFSKKKMKKYWFCGCQMFTHNHFLKTWSKSRELKFYWTIFVHSVSSDTVQITLQMQIENPETPPTPSSRDAQSPEGIASLSSGSSDNALGK